MLPLDRRRFLLGSLAGLTLLPRARIAGAVRPIMNIVPGLNAAGAKVYRQLGAAAGNVVLSPLSIGLAFAMLHAGARGETEGEIGKLSASASGAVRPPRSRR